MTGPSPLASLARDCRTGVNRKTWLRPFSDRDTAVIWPESLIPSAPLRTYPLPAGMRVFRSTIGPFSPARKACVAELPAMNENPTTSPEPLMPNALLDVPPRVPRSEAPSIVPVAVVRKACPPPPTNPAPPTTCPASLIPLCEHHRHVEGDPRRRQLLQCVKPGCGSRYLDRPVAVPGRPSLPQLDALPHPPGVWDRMLLVFDQWIKLEAT